MKVLVTGSEGSLMQAVIPKLMAAGHTVHGADNLSRHYAIRGKGYEFTKVDLVDQAAVQDLFYQSSPDVVIQAAAKIYGVGGFNKHCADILADDVTLHSNILRQAANFDVKRVVYISSSMVYENCPQNPYSPVSESMVDNYPAPKTEYGLSKYVGERISLAFNKQNGVDYTIWRPFNIITPYETAENEIGISHVFADYIDQIVRLKNTKIPIIGNGNQIRCFTWIDEVADVIATHSFSEDTKNRIFNIGNQEPCSMKELAQLIRSKAMELELIAADTPELKFETIKEFPNDVKVRIPSVANIKYYLKWEAQVKLEQCIEKCLKEYIE